MLLTVTVLAEPLYIKSVGAVTVKSSSTRDAALISYVLFPAIVTLYLLLEAVTVIGYDPTLDVDVAVVVAIIPKSSSVSPSAKEESVANL